MHFKAHGKPLFSSHMIDLSEVHIYESKTKDRILRAFWGTEIKFQFFFSESVVTNKLLKITDDCLFINHRCSVLVHFQLSVELTGTVGTQHRIVQKVFDSNVTYGNHFGIGARHVFFSLFFLSYYSIRLTSSCRLFI